jgi:multidrug resistance efflux pump
VKRNTLLVGVVAAVAAAASIGWFFGSNIRSPAEIAAAAEPPEPSNITVAVVRQVLSADVITRGDIVFDDPVALSLSGSFADQPERLVVTQAVEVGSELAEGGMAVEVVGRPVFLLTGEIPMYRDLRPGSAGDDVLQLEEALARMGFFGGVPDEGWDQATGASVAAWYQEAGYRPNGLSEADEAALAASRERVRAAEGALADSQAALRDVSSGPGQSAIASAGAEISAAEDALDLAEIDAARANELAARAVTEAVATLAAAEGDLATASAELSEAQAANPPPSAEELGALQQAVEEAEAEVATATADLEQANFDLDRTIREQEGLIEVAQARVTVAKAALADLQQGVDTSPIRRQIDSARAELAAAREQLDELAVELGTWLPAGEVVFLSRLPVRVDQVTVSRGSIIEGAFMTVSGSELALRSSVSDRDATRVEEGMEVEIENPETGAAIPGVITSKADRAGTNGLASDRLYIEISPAEIPEEMIGSNVRVTIPVSSTGGEVLAVPAAALSATADGSTILQVEDPDGTLRTVKVEPGLAAGGLVEVTPLEGELVEGDQVVVGRVDGSIPEGSTGTTEGS